MRAADVMGSEEVARVGARLDGFLRARGFECHPFLTGWYDARVGDKFALPSGGDPRTLAFVVLSQPGMFEKAFLPWLLKRAGGGEDQQQPHCATAAGRDPLDSCILETVSGARAVFPDADLEILHDFELRPNRRPKVLVQTAAHVSGAVHFFQPAQVSDQERLRAAVQSPKIYPVCLHPRFGGWFAIRAVVVFKNVVAPGLEERPCQDERLRLGEETVTELLRLYNDHWRDWRFRDGRVLARDVIAPEERYSALQREYFATKPAERHELVRMVMLAQKKEKERSSDAAAEDRTAVPVEEAKINGL